MSLTVEEIRKRVAEDKMHASTVIYVLPLLDRIDELEKEIETFKARIIKWADNNRPG